MRGEGAVIDPAQFRNGNIDGNRQAMAMGPMNRREQLLLLAGGAYTLGHASRASALGAGQQTIAVDFALETGAGRIGTAGGGTVQDFIDGLVSHDGSEAVGFVQAGTGAVPRTVRAKLRDVVSAADFGVRADGETDDRPAMQRALDHAAANNIGAIVLPAGEIVLTGDLILSPHSGETPNALTQIIVTGSGCGQNGTWLRFRSGSLRVHSPSHMLRDFRVTSEDGDGVKIEPNMSSSRFPARGAMQNIRAERCRGSGFTFEDCWCYRIDNCYARFNGKWGLEGKTGSLTGLAVNILEISGGEFQGNGTVAGPRIGRGGTGRGTGGGIFTGRCVQFNLRGVTIEGNVGDGLKLGEQCRGVAVDGCYFEKNGSHPANRDICNDRPSAPVNGPNSVRILNCNFLPQNGNGTAQERAIDLWDVIDLQIVHPQIFAQSGPVLYAAEPIRVRESVVRRVRGWVEGGWYSSAGYTQSWLLNETHRFGFPRKYLFSEDLEMRKVAGRTAGRTHRVRMPATCGRGVDLELMTRTGGAAGAARLIRNLGRGPAGTLFSAMALQIEHPSPGASVYTHARSANDDLPGTHLEVQIVREAGDRRDTLPGSVFLQAIEITIYEGRISAA